MSRYDEERIFSPENEKTRTLLACFSNHDAAQPTVSDLDRGHLLGVIRNAVGFIARLRAARSTFKYPLPTVISSCDATSASTVDKRRTKPKVTLENSRIEG